MTAIDAAFALHWEGTLSRLVRLHGLPEDRVREFCLIAFIAGSMQGISECSPKPINIDRILAACSRDMQEAEGGYVAP